jgi:hypothetical protein
MMNLAMTRSNVLHRLEVSEIGLKSLQDSGWATLAIGVMCAVSHCSGTKPDAMNKLKSTAITPQSSSLADLSR